MAAPMRDPPLDGGHRAKVADARAAARTDQANNFEYDDNEWDIGIGDLIIDLDADIEKTREGTPGGGMASAAGPGKAAAKMGADHSATLDKGLKMKIKRTKPGGKASEAKHEIVKSAELNGGGGGQSGADEGAAPVNATAAAGAGGATTPARRASGAHRRDKARDKHPPEVNGVSQASAAAANAGVSATAQALQEQQPTVAVNTVAAVTNANGTVAQTPTEPPPAPSAPPPLAQVDSQDRPRPSPPPAKRIKSELKESADVCVGTSVGTITEPDCLGPCEPGTSVTLEGIVWHETEGGVLVVNVTWRGKTYVGTLLDCTRHDWAPPRFCDSPTEELDARTPKGRGKRGRAAAPGDLSNFTETRSSVHSKLRNGGAKGRRGGATGVPSGGIGSGREVPSPPPASRSEPVSSPVSSTNNKRKPRGSEEDSPASKRRTPASPPASPALLECPEPNCSKKYKHINGLKYHQSHAHGAIDDDEVKDIASMSENDESNTEAPSPMGPVKSPEKLQEPGTPKKEDRQDAGTPAPSSRAPSPPPPPPPAPQTPTVPIVPPVILPMVPPVVPTPAVDGKPALVKPGVLRFGPQEDFPVAGFISKPTTTPTNIPPPVVAPTAAVVRPIETTLPQYPNQLTTNHQTPPPPPLQHTPHTVHSQLTQPLANHIQIPVQPNPQLNSLLPQNLCPTNQAKNPPPSPQNSQFKVKPTAALMPVDDKKLQDTRMLSKTPQNTTAIKKNKNRKSPGGSPLPQEQTTFGIEQPSRDEVQSPAYSDISDDTAPVIDSDSDKSKGLGDKKVDGGPLPHTIPGYGMYQFYGQPPYLVPSVQSQSTADQMKLKDDSNKLSDVKNLSDKDLKRDSMSDNIVPQKMMPQHYYPYGYIPPGYPYNMEPGYGPVSMVPEDKLKDQERERDRSKESPSPADHSNGKPPSSNQQPLLLSGKPKSDIMNKETKHPNENHQILKESIEMKSQMNPYLYQRHQAQQAHQQAQHQRDEDMRRYYMSLEQQRRKESSVMNLDVGSGKSSIVQQSPIANKSQNNQTPTKPQPNKDIKIEDGSKMSVKEDVKPIKQEGQKPTMETTGPPPPPTSQYYLHPSYMQPSHYGGLPFDPMYRGLNPMLVSSPYGPGTYLHPGPMPRYHAPEDLSRPPPPSKALDLLQHHQQFYSSHKIHELQERALKSPTPKAQGPGGSPGNGPLNTSNSAPGPLATPPAKSSGPPTTPSTETASGKEARSPPPQRHVHTHHHTHVGLGYPIYPTTYGAAVLASQQAAAVTVVNSFPPK